MKRILFALFTLIALAMLCNTSKAQTVISGGSVWVDPTSYFFYYPMGASSRLILGSSQMAGSITAASAQIAATDAKVVSTPVMPANRLVAGSVIRVTIIGTDTSRNAGAPVLVLRYGTVATTSADTLARVTWGASADSGNGIPFVMTAYVTIRTAGSAATASGYGTIVNQGTTGISGTATQVVAAVTKTINTTTANTYLTASLASGNSGNKIQIQQATIDFPVK